MNRITVEGVVGTGLVFAMVASVFLGDEKLANDIAMGLIGFLGRHVVTMGEDKK